MWKEFKEFAFKGNVVDMAVGMVVGAAFTSIVKSLVGDIITPLIGLLTKGIDFKDLQVVLATDAEGAVTSALNYGAFIQNVIDFFIVAFTIFAVIKMMSIARKKFEKKEEVVEEIVEEPKPTSEDLLAEIRDLLKEKN
ncbi:MAG: large-conductance mechanosensitive channel protein MscL [Clostridia bacterium]|nr:large-conductance mechanosensitive channel protein MscL [Clostridia bacterium]